MKNKVRKTNAVRMLESAGVPYELRQYSVVGSDLGTGFAVKVAEKVGLPPAQVFKTLVVRDSDGEIRLACVPSDTELDLKAFAKALGLKKAELVPVKDVETVTGYARGSVSPIGTKRSMTVSLDISALDWPVIALSAGVHGLQMLVAPCDLMRVVRVEHHPIAARVYQR